MNPIQILPDSLINKIAAGEVVERPASVVKELLENALDAGATNIDISLEEGGKKSILVRDNGCGIPPEELRLAVSRHATSKIGSLDDLFGINTLGFRGEALASIASVSKMAITSKRKSLGTGSAAPHPRPTASSSTIHGDDRKIRELGLLAVAGGPPVASPLPKDFRQDNTDAHEIRLEGGDIVFDGASAHPEGTTVLVKYLFYQTPARLKFLKSPETEMTHIVDCVTRAALANPTVAIRLTHNGKKILATGGEGGLKTTLTSLFDKETASQSYEVVGGTATPTRGPSTKWSPFGIGAGGGNGEITVTGLAGHPSISRSHQRNLYLFVNGRPVRDKVLAHAVMEAYRNCLMRGRYPFAVIFLNLPNEMVDVNVHPAKAEVRFTNSQIVHNYVQTSVRKTLEGEPWKGKSGSNQIGVEKTFVGFEAAFSGDSRAPHEGEREWKRRDCRGSVPAPPMGWLSERQDAEKTMEAFSTGQNHLTPIGQILGTYLVCEATDKLVLIDQHAAHERILFDRLLEQYKEGGIASQGLLIPENFDLPPSESEILKQYLKDLELFGLEIEFFGGCTFIVRSVPVLFQNRVSTKKLVLDITGDQIEKGKLTSLTDNTNNLLARMACHSAVRANRRLTVSEIKSLLDDLERYPLTSFCPHGRPVAVEISQRELEKWFKRVL